MQKLITLTIDISSLQAQSAGPFSVSEIGEVGGMLAAGWCIESWEFVTGDDERTKAVVMMLLNDGMDGVAYEDEFYELDEPEYLEDEDSEGREDSDSGAADEDGGNQDHAEGSRRDS